MKKLLKLFHQWLECCTPEDERFFAIIRKLRKIIHELRILISLKDAEIKDLRAQFRELKKIKK